MKVLPSSSIAGEVERWHRVHRWILDEHPYLAHQLSMFNLQAHRGITEVVDCKWGVAETRNSKVQGTRKFRQVWAAVCVILYILCGDLYCLRCGLLVDALEELLPALI
jgi:hypothetical protein